MIKKTLGGDRLGSGNKMKVALHNYERSTHDLGNVWRSTMAPGVLVPFYKKICTNGDTWTINLTEIVRTMPAIGPLFGTYKMQMDFFEIPIRLYNGILHNNMTKIGMDMAKVKLPKIELQAKWQNPVLLDIKENEKKQINSSSLMCYLGLRGVGEGQVTGNYYDGILKRKFNAVPILGYYDIFKNYYANKQEENAYVIDCDITAENPDVTGFEYYANYTDAEHTPIKPEWENTTNDGKYYAKIKQSTTTEGNPILNGYNLSGLTEIKIKIKGTYQKNSACIVFGKIIGEGQGDNSLEMVSIEDADPNLWTERYNETDGTLTLTGFRKSALLDYYNTIMEFTGDDEATQDNLIVMGIAYDAIGTYNREVKLKPFPLSNIDDMRMWLLQNTTLGTELTINTQNKLPYSANYGTKADDNSACKNPMNGLVVKTYQSDIFNCWLSSQWIDSVNGISAISAVAVEDDKFTIDALNLAKKVYNMLNRVAVSDGTYEGWQEAIYGEDALRRAESPIYCGGASGYINFEEVVSTADTETSAAGDQPLGSLAGKGTLTNVEGGNVEIHIKEPSYIMGIVSITPLIDYNQGNDFDMTEIDSLNDLHKPELDEIGFQDLILERAAWWSTYYDYDEGVWTKQAGGKLPAWIDYMTSVNQVYGDFCDKENLGFMVLTRQYEEGWHQLNESEHIDDEAPQQAYTLVKDWTTYINPTKFNYQFADSSLTAQNFWVQIGINAICRRKISAKLIPNL